MLKISRRHKQTTEAHDEIDVTSFMSLMIILVPVLLLSMTLTQITALEVKLPQAGGGTDTAVKARSNLELTLTEAGYKVNFADGKYLKEIPMLGSTPNARLNTLGLSQVLQTIKKQVPEKRDIVIKIAPNMDYQSVIQAIETAKSYRTRVVASVAAVELFPDVSLEQISES